MSVPEPEPAAPVRAWRLGFFFGALYFLQGIGEPTEGLIAQPIRSLLKDWNLSAGAITGFMAALAIPWSLKPAYGVLTDFVPLFGTRRRGYLVLAGAASAFGLLGLYVLPVHAGDTAALLTWLLIPTVAVALADVAADALMIECGQSRGLTGTLQAVQWGCLHAAGIVTGLVGGALSAGHHADRAFLICGIAGLLTFAVGLACLSDPLFARDRTGVSTTGGGPRTALTTALRPGPGSVLAVGGFLFLWNFNPFGNAVLHVHMTRGLGFSEWFYGVTIALTSVASIVASLGYGMYCRHVPMSYLIHASIALGVLSTLGYTGLADERSALLVTAVTGFTYMTATLIQLDLAARVCPPRAAGTVFAVLMALENLSASLSTWLGGLLYDQGVATLGSRPAFQVLVLAGSATTAGCWVLVPWLPKAATVTIGNDRGANSDETIPGPDP
jgi:hypothetical protein